jgi:4-diphosphocytidyl-2-C-methyl-D-erythritol kinase
MPTARVAAQAKVNLLLRIGPRDATGYHFLCTQFQRIELADDVVVRLGGRTRSLDCAGPFLPAGGLGPVERNLAYRAAVAYVDRSSVGAGFAIELTKHIPVGGGLGGGSADAGAVLRCLDHLSARPLGQEQLQPIARSLGADVPFLTGEAAAGLAVGYGDRWGPLRPPLPPAEMLLAVPSFSIATADAYRWLDEAAAGTIDAEALRSGPHGEPFIDFDGCHSWREAPHLSHNDFEAALEPKFPVLREIREGLRASGALVARLSGSGSTVFAVYEGAAPPPSALHLAAQLIPTRSANRVVQVEVTE